MSFVGVLHLPIDSSYSWRPSVETPVLVHAGMEKVLVDGGQFDGELLVEELDDFLVAFMLPPGVQVVG